jgi:hypothetical protein
MTTYVFGAGASCDAGYPLAAEMGKKLLAFMESSSDFQIRASGEFLRKRFGESSNIEDLITELQRQVEVLAGSTNPQNDAQRTRLGMARGWLGEALKQWFTQIRSNPAPGYKIFAERIVCPGDTIITFNYDDSLEREMRRRNGWDIVQGYGFQLGEPQRVSETTILKLHGSINWLVSILGGASGGEFLIDPFSSLGESPVIHEADLHFLGYDDFQGNTYRSGGAFPCLILPGRSKEFFYDTSMGREYEDFWSCLWTQAARAVNGCERIVIAGYSLPTADQRARELLLNGRNKQIHVEIVCGSQSARIAKEFSVAGFENVAVFRGGYFRDWCDNELG